MPALPPPMTATRWRPEMARRWVRGWRSRRSSFSSGRVPGAGCRVSGVGGVGRVLDGSCRGPGVRRGPGRARCAAASAAGRAQARWYSSASVRRDHRPPSPQAPRTSPRRFASHFRCLLKYHQGVSCCRVAARERRQNTLGVFALQGHNVRRCARFKGSPERRCAGLGRRRVIRVPPLGGVPRSVWCRRGGASLLTTAMPLPPVRGHGLPRQRRST